VSEGNRRGFASEGDGEPSDSRSIQAAPRADRPSRTSIAVVSEHVSFTELLATVIDAIDDLAFAGAASLGREAVSMVRRVRPQVVLIDAAVPDASWNDLLLELRRAVPTARILILIGDLDPSAMVKALDAGASGFVRKKDSVDGVIRAIRGARDGEVVVDQAMLTHLIERRREPAARAQPAAVGSLTAREIEVLGLMGRGLDPLAIAAELGIRISTCRSYEKNILAKLEAHTQLEAVIIAIRRGMIPHEGA
jgi:DNA-binding NarL/FixJ family response regulator